ncbi:MAG: glycogen synthase GlgA [Rhodothermaceae bacterium]|nr:glycogen synthase GlgA [Rhodothermaceae bacterium]
MNICFATSECVPFVKTGGLADVSGALPKALAQIGCNVKVFVPLYQSIHTDKYDLIFASDLYNTQIDADTYHRHFNTWYGKLPDSDVEVYFVDCPGYFHRSSTYTNDMDEGERFIFFNHAVFSIMQRYNWHPDIIHCNDWQTSLMPAMAKHRYNWDSLFQGTASVLSIHNIGYQGRYGQHYVHSAGLPQDFFYPGGPVEYHGSFSFMKTGVVFADAISTVSPTYAQEIQTPSFGEGLDGILRTRSQDVWGILNGIDTTDWNPSLDPHIASTFDASSLEKKLINKKAVVEEMGLPYREETPVIGIISRFANQKGFDLLKPVLENILYHHDVQFVVLGSGEQHIEDFFNWAHTAHPDRVGIYIGYNNGLAHRIEAGSDMFLMPSAYEPCGLNQMYSLNYGTVPIVHKIGGLADTVQDYHEHHGKGNGFSFYEFSPHVLRDTIVRALAVYHDKEAWNAIVQRGMAQDFTWENSANIYKELYEYAAGKV